MMERVYQALEKLRVPIMCDEYELHRLVIACLHENNLACAHEVTLAPRCRIDLMCGDVGIEIKRGKPNGQTLLGQCTRYLQTGRLSGLIVICERNVTLPQTIGGKEVRLLCLNRLWGIAL